MITEFALLRLRSDTASAFERAFASVAQLLADADGCLGHRLVATLDDPDAYLLEVVWRDLEAHVHGFELSEAHAVFMTALEPFLTDEPVVVHVPAGRPS